MVASAAASNGVTTIVSARCPRTGLWACEAAQYGNVERANVEDTRSSTPASSLFLFLALSLVGKLLGHLTDSGANGEGGHSVVGGVAACAPLVQIPAGAAAAVCGGSAHAIAGLNETGVQRAMKVARPSQ